MGVGKEKFDESFVWGGVGPEFRKTEIIGVPERKLVGNAPKCCTLDLMSWRGDFLERW
jgi:hypothetical protein